MGIVWVSYCFCKLMLTQYKYITLWFCRSKGSSWTKIRCRQACIPLCGLGRRSCFLALPSFTHCLPPLPGSHLLPFQRHLWPVESPTSITLTLTALPSFTYRYPCNCMEPTQISQENRSISYPEFRKLVRTLCHVRWHSHTLWGLGHGHLLGEGALFCLQKGYWWFI